MGLFFVDKDEKDVQVKKKTSVKETKFPTNSDEAFESDSSAKTKFPTKSNDNVSDDHKDMFDELFQKTFEASNQDGYDFYEFFQAITQSGSNDPNMYKMAMNMAKGMDKTITKDKLLTSADFYINEITKVYNKNVASGTAKKEKISADKNDENQNLTSDLENLKGQLAALQTQILDRETKLSAIDGKYQPLLKEMDSKLMANDLAKNKIVTYLETVKGGVANNLK